MDMTPSGHIYSWSDYLKRKGNMNIKLWDLYETLIVYILLSSLQYVSMTLTVNRLDVRIFITWIESADWIPWLHMQITHNDQQGVGSNQFWKYVFKEKQWLLNILWHTSKGQRIFSNHCFSLNICFVRVGYCVRPVQ